MNNKPTPRFKIGERVLRPEYWGNRIVTITGIVYDETDNTAFGKDIADHPFIYSFKEKGAEDGAWDYQLISEEVWNSPLYKAMSENE